MKLFTRHRKAVPTLNTHQIAVAWQAISLMLDYPTPHSIQQIGALAPELEELPDPVRLPLQQMVLFLEATPLAVLEADYVETFDVTRKCCLYLSYFHAGDTRKRGVALVEFKQAFRKAGLEVAGEELPDHLCVVLECGAIADQKIAWKLLTDHRAGIEMLRVALLERESPWTPAVIALSATLPELQGDDHEVLAKLISDGPPAEEVGLQPYAMDPRLNPIPHDPAAMSNPVGAK